MSKKILVIEDAKDIQQILSLHLEELGFNDIDFVSDGKNALQNLAQQSYSLIFLDLELPDITGISILDSIRVAHPQVPVIICSAHNTVDYVKHTWEMGAKGFLTKPIDPNKLENILSRNGLLN